MSAGPGLDAVDADPERRELDGHYLAQGNEAALGHAVGRELATCSERVHGGGEQDHAASRLGHRAGRPLGEDEEAREVDLELARPGLVRELEERRRPGHGGVVDDDDVEPAAASRAVATACSHEPVSPRSARIGTALVPRLSSSAQTDSSLSGRRSTRHAVAAPSRANARAVASPEPAPCSGQENVFLRHSRRHGE